MKFKTDEELLSDDLYSALDIEVYNHLKNNKEALNKLSDSLDDEETMEKYLELTKDSQVKYQVTEALYSMELSKNEIIALTTLSERGVLLDIICKIISNSKVNIYDKDELTKMLSLVTQSLANVTSDILKEA